MKLSAARAGHEDPEEGLRQTISQEIRAYVRSVGAMDERVSELLQINCTDLRCFDLLEQHRRMSAGDLARSTGLTTGAVTTLVDRLERAGFARRVADTRDRRKVFIEPTLRAERVANEIYQPLLERHREHIERYTTAELTLIHEFLRRTREINEDFAAHLHGGAALSDTEAGGIEEDG